HKPGNCLTVAIPRRQNGRQLKTGRCRSGDTAGLEQSCDGFSLPITGSPQTDVHPCRRGFAYERPPIPLVVSSSRCKQCDQPLVEIDHWAERPVGCIKCNLWRKGRARMSATARLRMARWRNRHGFAEPSPTPLRVANATE